MGLLLDSELSGEEEVKYILECREDISNFEPLYDAYHHRILNYIYHKVLDKELAADICSQVFLKAMTGIKKYKIRETPFSSWLYKIAYNEVMMFFRRSKKSRHVILDHAVIDGLQAELNEFDKEALLISVENVIGNLSEKELELIELRFYENKSFKEIGEIFSCSEGSVKVRSHRLMMKLKKDLVKKQRGDEN